MSNLNANITGLQQKVAREIDSLNLSEGHKKKLHDFLEVLVCSVGDLQCGSSSSLKEKKEFFSEGDNLDLYHEILGELKENQENQEHFEQQYQGARQLLEEYLQDMEDLEHDFELRKKALHDKQARDIRLIKARFLQSGRTEEQWHEFMEMIYMELALDYLENDFPIPRDLEEIAEDIKNREDMNEEAAA